MVMEVRKTATWDLRQADLFAGLSDRELAKIAKICQERVYEPGTTIFAAGTKADDVYIVLDGQVVIEIEINSGERRILTCVDTVRKGGVFAWSALVEPRVLTASARCTEGARVITINGKALLDMFEEFPYMGLTVMKNLSSVISSRLTDTRVGLQREIRRLLLSDW